MSQTTSPSPQSTPSPAPLLFLWHNLKKYPWDITKALLAVLLTSAAILGVGYGLRTLVDKGFTAENSELLNTSALFLVGLALTLAFSAYLRTSTTAWLGEKIINDLRQKVFSHTMNLTIESFERNRLGDLLSRLNTDCDQIRTFISGSAAVALRTLLQLIGGTTLLIISSPQLTLYVFGIIPFIIVPISLFGKKVKALTHDAQALDGEALSFAEERINALTIIKSFTAETYANAVFAKLQNKKLSLVKRRTHYRSLLISLVIALIFSGIAGILWVGAHEVIADRLTAGQLSSFVFYAIVVAGSMNSFAEIISNFNMTLGATTRITELLDKPTEPPSHKNKGKEALSQGLSWNPQSFQSLEFKEISFTYPARAHVEVLNKISFTLHKGQKIALVGPSGVGKSTLFKMLLRFYQPNQGDILLNNTSLKTYNLDDIRNLFTLVPQDPVIFNTSIINNIALGNPHATREEILEAAKQAHIDEFATNFPKGYETELGEKGVRLSGGQKQRVALARAILKNAPIFLLDEATNALDSQSEQRIQEALHRILKDKSALIIAHRLSTVKEADQIIVLSEKTIDAVGTHTQLMKTSPLYKTLAKQQFLDL